MRLIAALGLALGWMTLAPGVPAASLDRKLMLAVLRRATPELRSCAGQHGLPSGRYAMTLQVDALGRVQSARLGERPATIRRAAVVCITGAFARLRFPRANEALVAWSAASPPSPSYSLTYPFVLALPAVSTKSVPAPGSAAAPVRSPRSRGNPRFR
ncbi:MAG: hypothetical protein KF718_18265 [Polyangiaceae bacterium]|nr:hypothetical protein [Polyangiaceae bacterium]